MRMAATVIAVGMTLGTAYVLYAESTETRQLETRVLALEQTREGLVSEVADLKARRAHLSRPARIEAAARALGMRPAGGADMARLGEVVPAVAKAGAAAGADRR